MVTKEQAINAGNRAVSGGGEFHRGTCTRTVGPRGGVTETVQRWRASGRCKTWVTRPDEFHLPIKFGLYASACIDQDNAHDFHLASECPLLAPEKV